MKTLRLILRIALLPIFIPAVLLYSIALCLVKQREDEMSSVTEDWIAEGVEQL